MGLKVYNSLTRQREDFVPLEPPRVGIYVCGPTVYGHSHLGHAKSYVSFDTIVRWLRTPPPLGPGYTVNYVQNITDVGHLTDDADEGEDKIVAEARRRGLHPMAVVETFLRSYLEDMDALNVLRPDIMPRASGHIPEQIEQAKALIARGHAYEVNGSVYFSVASYPGYGKLSGRRFEQMEAGARVEINPEKRHPADFALWKRAEPGHIMRWPSPWGEGYPGWHLECSVMSAKYLGTTFDIHGGGIENQFPHHECEIAQHECATGRPFARYWLHNNMCTIEGQKMGKSLGNSVSLKDVFYGREGGVVDSKGNVLLDKTFEPVVVRHFILTSHYRQPLDFSSEALRAAESGSCRLRDALRDLSAAARQAPSAPPRPQVSEALAELRRRFAQAMDEDFNTAAAIAVVFDFARQSSAWVAGGLGREDLLAAESLMRQMACDVLGFRWSEGSGGRAGEQRDQLIRILVELRSEARKSRNFALSDRIREQLAAVGVQLQDGPAGTTWQT
jgi:cysteinyl-tRNA synthetase